ncbi:MAG: hypothetical protein ACLVJ4_00070 [Mediterraneibacter sp.]
MSGYENSREDRDRERSWLSLTAAVKALLSENLLTEEQAEDLYQRICRRTGEEGNVL